MENTPLKMGFEWGTVETPKLKSFYDRQEFVRSKFNSTYSETNFVARFFYTYAMPVINSVNLKNGLIEL